MKKNRIGKKCNEGGRIKKKVSSISAVPVAVFVDINPDNEIRRAKKAAQKKAAKKKLKKKINETYFIDVSLIYDKVYTCGCIENYQEQERKKVYASSIEDAAKQIINLKEGDINKVEFFDYSDCEYYIEGREYCDKFIVVKIYFNDNKFIVNHICNECEEEERRKEEEEYMILFEDAVRSSNKMLDNYLADKLFNIYVYAHGLYAYNHNGGLDIITSRLNNILTNGDLMSICCSWKNQPIGPVGIYVKGAVEMVANTDLSSYIDSQGERRFIVESSIEGLTPTIIDSPNDLDFTIHNHIEVFIKCPQVVGIWVKDWFVTPENSDILASLNKIANENNMAINVVKARRK